jgi:ubiquinone/menaquinone biosynthesis C-methylase UbiE
MPVRNIDRQTVEGFGAEWARFDQNALSDDHLDDFQHYFQIFPWESLPRQAVGFDLGCGSGRWARLVAPRVGTLHCIDPSPAALEVARRNLEDHSNCRFHLAAVDDITLADGSMDFGYALGVLHHLPDPAAGLQACVRKLKAGAPLLVYIYYAFDNRPRWFRIVWHGSNLLRLGIARLPFRLRYALSQFLAAVIYWPLARLSAALERRGFAVEHLPLSGYRHKSFYTMRTDALDRFGTRLEHRFTAAEIRQMMTQAGLEEIRFSPSLPFWCAVGRKSAAADRSLGPDTRDPG